MLILLDKYVFDIFSEDVETGSENWFNDKKISKNDLSTLIFQEYCKNMRKK